MFSVHVDIPLSFSLLVFTNTAQTSSHTKRWISTKATPVTTLLELHDGSRQGRSRNCSQSFPLPCEGAQTFTRSGAAVVLQVGAVLPFVVFRAVTEIVHGKIEALGTVLTRIWLTVIYVQLQVAQREEREVEGGGGGEKAEWNWSFIRGFPHYDRQTLWNLTFFYLLPQWIVHNAQSLVRLATISADSALDLKQPLRVNS